MHRMILSFLCMAVSQSVLASWYDPIESRGEMLWMIPGVLFLVGGIVGFFLHMGIVALRKKPTEISLNMPETKWNDIIYEDNKIIPPIPMVGPSISNNTSEVLVGWDIVSPKLFPHSSSVWEDNMSEVLVSKDVTGDEAIPTVAEAEEGRVLPVSQEDTIRVTPSIHQDSIGTITSQSTLPSADTLPALSAVVHEELLSSPVVLPELTAPEEQNLLASRELPELLDVVSQNELPQSTK